MNQKISVSVASIQNLGPTRTYSEKNLPVLSESLGCNRQEGRGRRRSGGANISGSPFPWAGPSRVPVPLALARGAERIGRATSEPRARIRREKSPGALGRNYPVSTRSFPNMTSMRWSQLAKRAQFKRVENSWKKATREP